MSPSIFICHSEKEAAIALEIADALEAAGYRTWYHERDSFPGVEYLRQVSRALDEVQAILILISGWALQSIQIRNEAVRAYESGKPFIPVLYKISHDEFQKRDPVLRQCLGAATSIQIPPEGVQRIIPRLLEGILALGIQPDRSPLHNPPVPPRPHPAMGTKTSPGQGRRVSHSPNFKIIVGLCIAAGTVAVLFASQRAWRSGSFHGDSLAATSNAQKGVLNEIPSLVSIGPKSVHVGKELVFSVSVVGSESRSMRLRAHPLPDHAQFSDNRNGTGEFRFRPEPGQIGRHRVAFYASGEAHLDSELVAITVSKALGSSTAATERGKLRDAYDLGLNLSTLSRAEKLNPHSERIAALRSETEGLARSLDIDLDSSAGIPTADQTSATLQNIDERLSDIARLGFCLADLIGKPESDESAQAIGPPEESVIRILVDDFGFGRDEALRWAARFSSGTMVEREKAYGALYDEICGKLFSGD